LITQRRIITKTNKRNSKLIKIKGLTTSIHEQGGCFHAAEGLPCIGGSVGSSRGDNGG